jgi:hypothetical protein
MTRPAWHSREDYHVQVEYPLQWPVHVPRTTERKDALFRRKGDSWRRHRRTLAEARDYVAGELFRMECDLVVISTGASTNRDGWSFTANRREPCDPGVAVYFEAGDDTRQVLAIDIYDRVADNLWAVGRTVEALRQIERDGGPKIGRAALSGFKALPESTSGPSWWKILGVDHQASGDEIRKAYRRLAREVHPDRPETGDQEKFLSVQEAARQGLAAREGRAL